MRCLKKGATEKEKWKSLFYLSPLFEVRADYVNPDLASTILFET